MSVETWHRMHTEDMAVADQGGVDLLFVGDSITALWEPQVWQEHFGRYRAANFGIGGDHTGNLLWRLQDGRAGQLHPKLVVLLIGVNNFGLLHESVPQVEAGIAACVARLRELYPGARILLNGVLPHEQAAASPARAEVRALNARLALLADGLHVFYHDYGPALLEPDDSIAPQAMADFLHPTAEGYRRWAAVMGPDIDALMATPTR
jgi:lysophospholipase L1-like esterase